MDHLSLTALKCLHDNDLPGAKRAIVSCIGLLERPSQVMMIFACTQLSLAILEVKRREPNQDVRTWWRKANGFLKTYSVIFPMGEPVLHYQRGLYAEMEGKTNKAIELWKKALQTSIDIDMPYVLANSVNKLKSYEPTILERYQEDYSKALSAMGVTSVTDDINVMV